MSSMSTTKRNAAAASGPKSTQPKQKRKSKPIKADLSRPPTADTHRRLLMQSPVPETVVINWAKRTVDSTSLEEGTAERHLAEVCTPANFGEWALTFGKKQSTPLWGYLRRGIRNAYAEASWEQKVDGIFAALECSHTSEIVSPQVGPQNTLAQSELESIANAVVEFHSDKVRKGDRLGTARRTCQLLGIVQMPRLLKQQITALKSGDPGVMNVGSSSTIRPRLSPIAAIVFRSRECRDVETYFTKSRAASLTAETIFLASALTYRPQWTVLFETPVKLRLEQREAVIESVSGTLSDEHVDVRFKAGPNSPAKVNARIPVRFGSRTFEPRTAEQAALVLLDLLFSREENLSTSSAKGDLIFAEKRLGRAGKSISALYRMSSLPSWSINDGRSRLEVKVSSDRSAHDVRGHFRTRNGVAYPVRPHQRKS